MENKSKYITSFTINFPHDIVRDIKTDFETGIEEDYKAYINIYKTDVIKEIDRNKPAVLLPVEEDVAYKPIN